MHSPNKTKKAETKQSSTKARSFTTGAQITVNNYRIFSMFVTSKARLFDIFNFYVSIMDENNFFMILNVTIENINENMNYSNK